jgi:hypothetical protein
MTRSHATAGYWIKDCRFRIVKQRDFGQSLLFPTSGVVLCFRLTRMIQGTLLESGNEDFARRTARGASQAPIPHIARSDRC